MVIPLHSVQITSLLSFCPHSYSTQSVICSGFCCTLVVWRGAVIDVEARRAQLKDHMMTDCDTVELFEKNKKKSLLQKTEFREKGRHFK